MDHFAYRQAALHAEDVALADIAAAIGTPVYVYSLATLSRHYRVFAEAFSGIDATICYAVKANGNLAVVRSLAALGAGADVVSGGELEVALLAGVPGERIVFSGVGKTDTEIAAALRAGVLQINVESVPELEAVNAVAAAMGTVAPVAIRINPDVDANTHAKISTGRKENKFGIEWTAAHRVFGDAIGLPAIRLQGVAVHIGSQVTTVEPFRDAFHRLRDLVAMLRADGHRIETLDLGGGLGVPYGEEAMPELPSPQEYAEVVNRTAGDLQCKILLEPGRVLAANAGVLVTRVLYVKEGATRTFIVVDAGMNDLMRPALYGAFHAIVPVAEPPAEAALREVDVVGPVCETSDTFGTARKLPPLVSGDLLAIRTAGAYGAAMASTYNARPLPAEVLVSRDRFAVVATRPTTAEMLGRQRVPDWLEPREVRLQATVR